MSFFGTKSQFFFKLCITLQCHETQLFCTFSSKTVYDVDKRSASKFKFSDFRTLAQKLTKFFMSFYKSRVSFLLNLALPFSVMTHNSSGILLLKHYMFWTKRTHQSTIFQFFKNSTFECSNQSSANSSCHFWNHKVRIYSNFASLLRIMKVTPLYPFSSNLIYVGKKEPIRVKFSDFEWLGWNIPHVILKSNVSFSSNFESLFSVMRDNSSVPFLAET